MLKLNPFIPKSGLEPKVFVNREDEINFFVTKLDEAKSFISNHYVITGGWGKGKTTLLKYLKGVAQEKNTLSTCFSAPEYIDTPTDKALVTGILQLIVRNLPVELPREGKFLSSIEALGIQIFGSGINLSFQPKEELLIEPQILLQQGLYDLWEDVKRRTDLLVVLMDDIQNLKDVAPFFTILKNVLSSDQILKTKYLFVLSSTIDGWKSFMVRNHPIGRYFIPIVRLNNLNEESTINLVTQTLSGTGVSFSQEVMGKIYQSTNGHLFETQALCSALYEIQTNGKVTASNWLTGFHKALQYLGDYVFDNILHEISQKEGDILAVLAHFDQPVNYERILQKSIELHKKISSSGVLLSRLVSKEVIEKPSRGLYYIPDIMFREYIKQMMNY